MKKESNIFDSIRIKSRSADKQKAEVPQCEWEGCEKPGTHKAPKAAGEGEGFKRFCVTHVRQYNQKFNFFANEGKDGKDKIDDLARQAARTGERPTWAMGANKHARSGPKPKARAGQRAENISVEDLAKSRSTDPHNLFARLAKNQGRVGPDETVRRIKMTTADRRAMEVLGLAGKQPNVDEIKRAYKDLVKKHHPDANGGDRSSEDRLRAIISAYTQMKQKGFG